MIVGQNSLLNQYVPTFKVTNITDGQILTFDSVQKAFINVDNLGHGGGGATKLGQLTDVSSNVDNPASVQNGQALVYNSFTHIWENSFVNYNTLLNKPVIPVNSNFSFSGLSDTAKPSLPNGYVKWNSAGTQLIYSTTIPASSITGLATVATTGDYNDLLNKPVVGSGTVTTVSVVSTNGVSGTVANPTTTPAISLTLGAITPTSVAATGTITGSNLSGVNTGNQTIALTGDVTGSGTGTFAATLASVNANVGTFGSSSLVPVITVDAKGRITGISTVGISTGSVTSVSVAGTAGRITSSGSPITSSGTITLDLAASGVTAGTYTAPNLNIDSYGRITAASSNSLVSSFNLRTGAITLNSNDVTTALGYTPGTVSTVAGSVANGVTVSVVSPQTTPTISVSLGAITPNSVAATGTISGSNFSGTSSGTNTGDQTITLSGDISGAGTGGITTSLATVNSAPGVYGSTNRIPVLTIDAKGRVISASNVVITAGTVTSVTVTGTQGVSTNVVNGTTTPAISIGLGAITPNSVTATGPVVGSNLSGTNTGDQTITIIGDATGSSTGVLPLTLNTVNTTPGAYGDASNVPTVNVNAKGLVTSVTTTPVDVTVSDILPANGSATETFTIQARHQYIITGRLDIVGHVVNNGRIAVL